MIFRVPRSQDQAVAHTQVYKVECPDITPIVQLEPIAFYSAYLDCVVRHSRGHSSKIWRNPLWIQSTTCYQRVPLCQHLEDLCTLLVFSSNTTTI